MYITVGSVGAGPEAYNNYLDRWYARALREYNDDLMRKIRKLRWYVHYSQSFICIEEVIDDPNF